MPPLSVAVEIIQAQNDSVKKRGFCQEILLDKRKEV